MVMNVNHLLINKPPYLWYTLVHIRCNVLFFYSPIELKLIYGKYFYNARMNQKLCLKVYLFVDPNYTIMYDSLLVITVVKQRGCYSGFS